MEMQRYESILSKLLLFVAWMMHRLEWKNTKTLVLRKHRIIGICGLKFLLTLT